MDTKNKSYSKKVESEQFPESNEVPLDDEFKDFRGKIQNLLLSPINSVARISSRKGTVRANHYHLTDWHYTFVESGSVFYFEREVGSTTIPEPKKFSQGSMFFTPSMKEHAMLFTADTVIFTFAKNFRNHKEHESDVRRIEFVNDSIIKQYLS